MTSNYQPTQDLASILATLAQHSQAQAQVQAQAQPSSQPYSHSQTYPYPASGSASAQAAPPPNNPSHYAALNQYQSHTQSHPPHSPPPHSHPPVSTHAAQAAAAAAAAAAATPSPIDPSKLTTYGPALRYTTSLLTTHPELLSRIKKLLRSQHDHERQWSAGRNAVLIERGKRVARKRAVDDVLKRLKTGSTTGGTAGRGGIGDAGEEGANGEGKGDDSIESEEQALHAYDVKIHALAGQMIADQRRQLKEMGIPGFVVRRELIGDGDGEVDGRVSREKIHELEERMVRLLEDMCRD